MIARKLTPALWFIIVWLAIAGCGAKAPLYVIDVQKLAGAKSQTADQLLQEMVPCQLIWEHRWEQKHWLKGEADVLHIGMLYERMYEIENRQIDRWQYKPRVQLFFDANYEERANVDYEGRVNGVTIHFIEYVEDMDVLRTLGYSPKERIKHRYSPNAWYFITEEHLHQVHLEDTGQSTAVTIHLDALTH